MPPAIAAAAPCGRAVGSVDPPGTTDAPSTAPTLANIPRAACWLDCGQLLARQLHALLEAPVAHHLALDLVDAMDHGRVVPAAEGLPDLDQLHAQHVPREVHGHLTGDGERLGAGLGAKALGGHAPPAGDHLLHPVDRGGGPPVDAAVVPLADLVRQG